MIVLVLAAVVGLYMAWNIGANDVANAMGTSVGSGALTMKQAIVLAGLFEFAGAVLVGSHVTNTVRKGVIEVSMFQGHAMLLAYGMTASLLAAALWLNVASWLGWPVSTTHSIIGAIVGFGLVAGGAGYIAWDGVGRIVASWVISPIMGGTIAFFTFLIIRDRILSRRDPVAAALKWGPLMLIPVGMVLTLAVVFKGLKNLHLDLSFNTALLLALGVGLLFAAMGKLFFPRIATRVGQHDREGDMARPYYVVEAIFAILQIFTACLVAFAHGANDVANAIGPLAAVINIVQSGEIASKVPVPLWVLVAGGAGIVVGLATFGYRVMATIGKKITEMTPTRGFSAEFGAATTILIGSRLGLPLSTTHTLVGSVIGVGLARGLSALDLGVLRGIVASWLLTLPFAGVLSALFFLLFKAVLG